MFRRCNLQRYAAAGRLAAAGWKMRQAVLLLILVLGAGFFAGLLPSVQADQQPDDKALPDDEAWLEADAEFRSREVNEGELRFIEAISNIDTLHSAVNLTIRQSSLVTGWVDLRQCYAVINPVAATDIVYHYKQIRNFRIVSSKNIGRAEIDGQSLQLQDITEDASICISAEINVLEKHGETYVISNGPYHLRFLDGYYPYHLTISIRYPAELIQLKTVTPLSQPLFEVQTVPGRVAIDSWFEGILTIVFVFERSNK